MNKARALADPKQARQQRSDAYDQYGGLHDAPTCRSWQMSAMDESGRAPLSRRQVIEFASTSTRHKIGVPYQSGHATGDFTFGETLQRCNAHSRRRLLKGFKQELSQIGET
jgi:hypothetical protein